MFFGSGVVVESPSWREGAASGAGAAGGASAETEGGGKYPFIFTYASATAAVYAFPTADTPYHAYGPGGSWGVYGFAGT